MLGCCDAFRILLMLLFAVHRHLLICRFCLCKQFGCNLRQLNVDPHFFSRISRARSLFATCLSLKPFHLHPVYSYQSSFIRNCLDAHNAVRALHGVPPLSWSSEIAVSAQKWANHLAAIDQLQHDSTTSDGENLFYMYGGDPGQACDRAVKNWYQEFKNYDFRSPHLEDSASECSIWLHVCTLIPHDDVKTW